MISRRDFVGSGATASWAVAQGPVKKPSIWDLHCHLTSATGDTPEERMTYLIRFMDRMKIERVMLSLGHTLVENPSTQQLREQNDQVIRAIQRWPDRALGFAYLNPNHLAFSLQEFDRCVRDGPMVAVKLWVAKRCSAPELDAIVERAEAMKAVILQHCWFKVNGNLPGESTSLDLVKLALRHPKAMFIDAHTGGDWELGIRAIQPVRNIATCVAGFDPTSGVVEMAVRELGASRVIFGSDGAGRSFASQLAKVIGAEIPDSARNMIFGENLRQMLMPILRAKGRQA